MTIFRPRSVRLTSLLANDPCSHLLSISASRRAAVNFLKHPISLRLCSFQSLHCTHYYRSPMHLLPSISVISQCIPGARCYLVEQRNWPRGKEIAVRFISHKALLYHHHPTTPLKNASIHKHLISHPPYSQLTLTPPNLSDTPQNGNQRKILVFANRWCRASFA